MSEVNLSGYPPRRAFKAKGSRVSRCSECLLPQQVCICALTPAIDVSASFWLLMHYNEQFKPTNTGRLLTSAIAGGGRTIWQRTEPDFRLLHLLARDDRYPVLVFPQALAEHNPVASQSCVRQAASDGREPVFILLDATWQQARKMYNRSPYLYDIPVLSVEPRQASGYRLRRSQTEGHLCTAEVGAECLSWLGEERAASVVSDYFRVFNERYFSARRSVPSEDTAALERLQGFLAANG